jgi:bacterial/archaeal transporter family protein
MVNSQAATMCREHILTRLMAGPNYSLREFRWDWSTCLAKGRLWPTEPSYIQWERLPAFHVGFEVGMTWFFWALLSALFAGVTAILAKVGVQNVSSNLATAIRTVVIFIFAWSVALLTRHQPIASLGKRTWLFLILSGLATGLSWLCYFRALQLGEASQVAPVDKLSVVIAIALAAIFLHERVTWVHWVGGLLIVSGSIILAYA